MSLTLYDDSDQVLVIPDVTDRDGTAQTNATVNVTLTDKAGTAISGSWPVAASHATPDGTYEAALADDVAIQKGQQLKAKVEITLATGEKTTVWEDVIVQRRSTG